MARIDHTNHAHPATAEARRRCRAARAAMDEAARKLAEREDGLAAAAAANRKHMIKVTAQAAFEAKQRAAHVHVFDYNVIPGDGFCRGCGKKESTINAGN